MMHAESIHPYWLVIVSVALALLPLLVGLCSSYLKVSIVLGMLRSGLGAQQVPSMMVVMALSVALSLQIMAPVAKRSWEVGKNLELHGTKGAPQKETLSRFLPLVEPWREFMAKHAGARELGVLMALGEDGRLAMDDAVVKEGEARLELARQQLEVVVPAFVLTELKEAFAMGFVLLLPFLVIDLIVANVLAGMGMMMVSPAMVSLPLKLVLFVAADGWLLLSKSLILSYGV